MRGQTICIGLVGAGYAAILHGTAYQRVCRVPICLKTVVDVDREKAQALQARFGAEGCATDLEEVLADPEIDVVDLVVPPQLHSEMVRRVLAAGKHVICEKPLLGYLGRPGDLAPIGDTVSRETMYQAVLEELEQLRAVVQVNGPTFFYAENFVYAAPVQRVAEIVRARKSKILSMKAVIALKGSSSPLAGEWRFTGGGCFARNGVHPLTAILWLKQQEAASRGEQIHVVSVTADMGTATRCLTEQEHRHISAAPVDVEDNAVVSLSFSDGTGAVIYASDTRLGGSRNSIDVYCNDGALECNLTPTDILSTYFLDEEGMDQIALAEMLPTVRGWNRAFVCDDVIRGHAGELQHFMECIAQGRTPETGFELAYETTKLVYAAYLSQERGARVRV